MEQKERTGNSFRLLLTTFAKQL